MKEQYEKEWHLLQAQNESYEKYSLIIKLLSISMLLLVLLSNTNSILITLVFLTLWLQDGIWKTFQSRIEPRLLRLEEIIAGNEDALAYQFNSEYQKHRRRGFGLVAEYISQALRPTVAFPHVVTVIVYLLAIFI